MFPCYFWVFLGVSWLFLGVSECFLAISGCFWVFPEKIPFRDAAWGVHGKKEESICMRG